MHIPGITEHAAELPLTITLSPDEAEVLREVCKHYLVANGFRAEAREGYMSAINAEHWRKKCESMQRLQARLQ